MWFGQIKIEMLIGHLNVDIKQEMPYLVQKLIRSIQDRNITFVFSILLSKMQDWIR